MSLLFLITLTTIFVSNAQKNIIGNPIKIGSLEVAQYDFPKIPWNDANNSCKGLGNGWRLPTINELNILYQNRDVIGNFKWDSYWSSTKGNVVIAWRLNFGDGMIYDHDNTDNTACVRAVKSKENSPNIANNQTRSSLIEGSGSVAKATENSNQSLEYDFSEIKSQGCDVIKSEFKQFAIKFISYKKRVKSNPSSLRFREDTDWENNLRKFSDLATDCAIKLKGDYASEVIGYLEKVSSLLPIDPIIPSSSRNNSSVQNKSTANTSQSKPTQTNNAVAKKVDLSTEVLSKIVSCKTCGNPVTIQKNVPRSPEFKNSFNESGGITSSMCQKCHKTSTFTYEIRNAQFVRVN